MSNEDTDTPYLNTTLVMGGAACYDIRLEPMRFRTENSTPTTFRLLCKKDGELVLQGGYTWFDQGATGITWRDLPTLNEEDLED